MADQGTANAGTPYQFYKSQTNGQDFYTYQPGTNAAPGQTQVSNQEGVNFYKNTPDYAKGFVADSLNSKNPYSGALQQTINTGQSQDSGLQQLKDPISGQVGWMTPAQQQAAAASPTPAQLGMQGQAFAQTQPNQGQNPTGVMTPSKPSTFEQGFNTAQKAGTTAPQSAGDARSMTSQYSPDTTPTPPNPKIDNFFATNGTLQATNQQLQDYLSPPTTQATLQSYIDQVAKDRTALAGLNTQLMNNKNIISGTEQDIRDEITKANGFATNSQVLALATARNKTLIDQDNKLVDLITSAQNAVSTDTTLLADEKQIAQQETSMRMNLLQLQQTNAEHMFNAANDTYKTLMDKNPEALLKSLQSDPIQAQRFQNITGLKTDTVQGIVDAGAVAKLKATLENTKLQADIKKTNAEIKQLSLQNSGTNYASGSGLPSVNMTANNVPSKVGQLSFLASLPGGLDGDLATEIRNIAEYRQNPTSIPTRNYKGVGGLTQSQVITLASKYDPSYDQTQYSARQLLRNDFTSGKSAQSINSLNTAVGHITDILDNTKNLGNYGGILSIFNNAKNNIAAFTGSGAPGAAKINIQAATGELAKLFTGVGATKEEINNLGVINANSSPDAVKQYIQVATQLLGSKLSALDDTYARGMGRAPDRPLLSPTSTAQLLSLQKQGFDIKVPELANAPQIKLQTFHDANSDNQKLIDGIVANHPEFKTNPDAMVNYLAQNGIEL